MKKIIILLFLLVSLVIAETSRGKVSFLEGNARKKNLNDSEWLFDVKEESDVKEQESYRTMVKSRAELELSDLDIIRLAPKTSIDIVSLYQESVNKVKSTNILLDEGEMWAQINSSDNDNLFEIDTDISGAAITGTNLRMLKKDGLTQMKVYHGEVKISNSKQNMNSIKPTRASDYRPQKSVGPKKIDGPKQITLKEWVIVVKNMEQITFNKNGEIISAGSFRYDDDSEKTIYRSHDDSEYNWVEWNRQRDRKKGLR